MNSIEIKDRSMKGFNESSYYVLHTNSLGSSEAALSGDSSKSKSRVHEINRQFGEIFTKNNALAFLFDPKETNIWITKKDSGSLLNVFGAFPAAVISTYNGEPTSGGASILPLPEPTEEQQPTVGGC